MRPKRLPTKFAASALGLALAAAVLAMPAPARAADDNVPLETKMLRGLLEGLGLRKDGEGINYQERSPLVIPPNLALPPPEKTGAALANNPAWPKDPDVAQRKLEAAQSGGTSAAEIEAESRPLRPDQLTPGGNSRSRAKRSQSASSYQGADGDRLTPSQLGYKGNIFKRIFSKDEESAKFTGETPRTSLTEPPPGYQTPSPDQPYGVGKDRTPAKPYDYLTNHGTDDQR